MHGKEGSFVRVIGVGRFEVRGDHVFNSFIGFSDKVGSCNSSLHQCGPSTADASEENTVLLYIDC